MNWSDLTDTSQLNELIEASTTQPIVIFKHSTRCSISLMAKGRLERQMNEDLNLPFYYLDLLKYRPVSNAVADILDVEHQSPQILLISKGQCVYTASHGSIDLEDLKQYLKDVRN